MGLFGKSKKEAWTEFAESMGAEAIDEGWAKGGIKVRLAYKSWEVVMDTYTVSTGKSSTTYTRVRAVFVLGMEFDFKIFRTSVLTKIANFFGKQSALTGDAAFDEIFTVRSSQENVVQSIFENETLKQMFLALKRVNFFVKKAKGKKETKHVDNEREVHYYMTGVIKDGEILALIFGIIINLLDEFEKHEIAKSDKPQISYLRPEQ